MTNPSRPRVRPWKGTPPPWRPRGWEVIAERGPGEGPTTSWHPTLEKAQETANWLAHYGRGH